MEDMQDYFGKSAMIPVIQGKKTLSQPMKCLGADLERKLIVYNNNPVDKWCLCNTAVDIDRNVTYSRSKQAVQEEGLMEQRRCWMPM